MIRPKFLFWVFAIVVLGAIWTFLGNYLSNRPMYAPTNECIANLRQLDGAKAQWLIEHKAEAASHTVTLEDLKAYLWHNQIPKCPKGGSYSLGGAPGDVPTCSVQGHVLPK